MANNTSNGKGIGSGWPSFIIAGVIYVIGYWLIAGEPPGVSGAFHWWSIIILLLLWGAASAALAALFGGGEDGD